MGKCEPWILREYYESKLTSGKFWVKPIDDDHKQKLLSADQETKPEDLKTIFEAGWAEAKAALEAAMQKFTRWETAEKTLVSELASLRKTLQESADWKEAADRTISQLEKAEREETAWQNKLDSLEAGEE